MSYSPNCSICDVALAFIVPSSTYAFAKSSARYACCVAFIALTYMLIYTPSKLLSGRLNEIELISPSAFFVWATVTGVPVVPFSV